MVANERQTLGVFLAFWLSLIFTYFFIPLFQFFSFVCNFHIVYFSIKAKYFLYKNKNAMTMDVIPET